MINYEDLELLIQPGEVGEYQLYVVHSPVGETNTTMHFPFDEVTLNNRLLTLENILLRSSGKRRRIVTEDEEVFREFGHQLFDSIFVGNVRTCYERSMDRAAQQGKGLRIRLRIQDPVLASIPWEYLFDSNQEEYVCLSTKRAIVRYPDFLNPIEPLTVTLPLRILGMVATPLELDTLDVDREKERMEVALGNLRESGMVELTWLKGQTWRHLQREMLSGPWHVFHFVGHGGFDESTQEGAISFCDEGGHEFLIRATQLGRLLADHHPLRLVFLNSCEGARGGRTDMFSSSASMLVRRGVSSVVAMQYEISDDASIEFARSFYETLAGGIPVDAAVAVARKAIDIGMGNTMEWGVPVLYMRAPDGVLFNIRERTEESKEKDETEIEYVEEEQVEAEQRINGDIKHLAPKYDELERLEREEQEQKVREKIAGYKAEHKRPEQRREVRSRFSWRRWSLVPIILAVIMSILYGLSSLTYYAGSLFVIVTTCAVAYKELPTWKALGVWVVLLHIATAAVISIASAAMLNWRYFYFTEGPSFSVMALVIGVPVNLILAWVIVRQRVRAHIINQKK